MEEEWKDEPGEKRGDHRREATGHGPAVELKHEAEDSHVDEE